MDLNNNGIPDSQEKWFVIARAVILLWSMAMLTVSYFKDTKVDQAFMVTVFTGTAATFALPKAKQEKKEEPKVPQGRTETPSDF